MATYGANKIANPSAASGVDSWGVTGVTAVSGGIAPGNNAFAINGLNGIMSQVLTAPGTAAAVKFGIAVFIEDDQSSAIYGYAQVLITFASGVRKIIPVPIVAAYDNALMGEVGGVSVAWCRLESVIALDNQEISNIVVSVFSAGYSLDVSFYVDDIYLGMEVSAGGEIYTDEMAVAAVEAEWLDPYGVMDLEFYADRMLGAYIADLTVARIETVNKLKAYLDGYTGDLNYWRGYEQNIEFVHATYANGEVQLSDVYSRPLFWRTAEKKGLTTQTTVWPAMVYTYTEQIKMKQSFYYDADLDEYLPKTVYGVGSGAGTWHGKGVVWKGIKGLYLDYFHSVTGQLRRIMLTDDGIDFSETVEGKVIYSNETAIEGATQVFVGTEFPAYAKEDDVLIKTNDYSSGDWIEASSSIAMTWNAPLHVAARGANTTIKLPSTAAGASVGVGLVCIQNHNTTNGIIMIVPADGETGYRTIGGLSAYPLPPLKSVTLRFCFDLYYMYSQWEVL